MSTSSLQQTFERAVYCIHLPESLATAWQREKQSFSIGETSQHLNEILDWAGGNSGYFITAYNPGGRQRSKAKNLLAQQELIRLIKDKGWLNFKGYSTNKDGSWPREESLLVFCEDESEILKLARQFGQAAICRLERDRPVSLLMLERY